MHLLGILSIFHQQCYRIGWSSGRSHLVPQQGWTYLIMEGNSLQIINMENKIQSGSTGSKVAKTWRLENSMGTLESLLLANPALVFHHVKRKSKILANSIYNNGVANSIEIQQLQWEYILGPTLRGT